MDGLEDGFEACVVFLFQCGEFARQHLPQADEGTHDFDVDLNGAFAAQDAGEHGDALFGEGVGGSADAAPT